MKTVQRAREMLDIEIAGLQRVRDGLGLEFTRSVKLLVEGLQQGGKIVITGIGKNLPIGRKIAATLTSTGAPAVVLHPLEALHGDLGIVQEHDIVLAMSYSGESRELLDLLPLLKRIGVRIIALTGVKDSALATFSDELIPVTVDREACPFNMAPTASTTATLAMGDALAMVLLEARGFGRDDYARLHPGGTIGQTLLTRVRDIMRTGDRLPRVRHGAPLREALLAMTHARSGSVAVVDESEKLLGIFTDGDLRRHMDELTRLDRLTVGDVMTANPVTIGAGQLAVDALTIYEEHKIDDLLVIDDQGRLVGLIDIQDLPRFKIL